MDEITQSLLDLIRQKDERIKELTDLMLKYTGVIRPDVEVIVPELPSANPHGKRWSRIQPMLEKLSSKGNWSKLADEAAKEVEPNASG